MPKRNPKNISFGVFTSASASSHLPKAEIERHFFATAYNNQFTEKKITEEDAVENMLHIHNAGKTYGPYLPYKKNEALLLDRTGITYNREFTQKPSIALQYEANKKLGEFFRPVRTKLRIPIKVVGWETSHAYDFPKESNPAVAEDKEESLRAFRAAKPALWKNPPGADLADVVGGKGKFFVTVSHNQTTHTGHIPTNSDGTKMDVNGTTAEAQKGNLNCQGYHTQRNSTQYQDQFSGEHQKRNQAVGTAFRMQLQKSIDGSSSGPSGSDGKRLKKSASTPGKL